MSGNGIDLGAIYQLLGTVAADMRELRSEVGDLRGEVGDLRRELRSEVGDLRRELRSEVGDLRRELATKADKEDVASLRQALTEYHASVLGHGVLISELEDRVRRIERHLKLPPAA